MTAIPTTDRAATASAVAEWIRHHPILAYFALAFAWTWALLVPFALDRNPYGLGLLPVALPDAAFFIAFIASTFGPLVAGVLATSALEGRAGVRRLLGRIVQWRVGWRWYLVALTSFLIVFLAAYGLAYRGAPVFGLAQQWPLLFTAFLPQVLLQLLIPALGEEPGWRGFALPRLQARYGPVAASLVLGGLHGLWHLPVLFTPLLGPFSWFGLAAFILTAIGGTFLYTWIVNSARGSLLIAMLIHAASNASSAFVGALMPADASPAGWAQAIQPAWLNALAFGLAALLLLIGTRGRLGYRRLPREDEAN